MNWLRVLDELFNDWGGRRYDDSVPGGVTKTAPSRDRTTRSPTWSASLPRIQLIPPGGWSNMSPVRATFVPFPPKTGTNLLDPRPPPPPQSLNWSDVQWRRGSARGHRTTPRRGKRLPWTWCTSTPRDHSRSHWEARDMSSCSWTALLASSTRAGPGTRAHLPFSVW